jgi:hypothetical protein
VEKLKKSLAGDTGARRKRFLSVWGLLRKALPVGARVFYTTLRNPAGKLV